jgi:hypothetical protein
MGMGVPGVPVTGWNPAAVTATLTAASALPMEVISTGVPLDLSSHKPSKDKQDSTTTVASTAAAAAPTAEKLPSTATAVNKTGAKGIKSPPVTKAAEPPKEVREILLLL